MHLYETPDNPCPRGAQVLSVKTEDNITLRAAHWPSLAHTSRGTVIICQGRTEFIEKYFEVIGELQARDFCVVAFDWRGQGGSQRALKNPRKGHIDDFSLFWQDIAAIERHILPQCPKPWFGLGHSMGGAILLDMAGSGVNIFDRLILSAPMVDIYGLKHPKATRLLIAALDALGLGGAYAPGGGDTAGSTLPFANNVLTSDLGRYSRTAEALAAAPQIGLGHCTIGWLDAAFRLIQKLADPEFPRRTLTPILILGAGSDKVVNQRAIEAFTHRLKAGRLITLLQSEHEILMERDTIRAQFWAAFDAFLPGEKGSK
jgi:lysophospholipase